MRSNIILAAPAGRESPASAHVILDDYALDSVAFGATLAIEMGNATFHGRLAGRGFVCGEAGCSFQLRVEFSDRETLRTFIETWQICESGSVRIKE